MKYRMNDITNFIEIAGCATIIQAAHKLEISQPALSESLKRLESDAGLTLFYRSRTGVQLTPSGKVFLDKAHRLQQSLQELDFDRKETEIFANRTLRIGCHMTIAQYCIPRTLSYLKSKAPDYKIELEHDFSRNIQEKIQKGLIDVGIVVNPSPVPDIVIHKLASDTVGVWAAKSSSELDTVICNAGFFQTASILKKWKNKPNKIITTDSLELISRLTSEKIGYGIIPERAVQLYAPHLVEQKSLPQYKDEFALVYRPEFGKIPAEKLTIEAIKRAF